MFNIVQNFTLRFTIKILEGVKNSNVIFWVFDTVLNIERVVEICSFHFGEIQ